MKAFSINIYCGLREGYSKEEHSLQDVYEICQYFCDNVGLCVTVTPTSYIYVNGGENGCIIGILNYPRFPKTKKELVNHALNLIDILKVKLKQIRISYTVNDKIYMVGE